jgi:hypothetical protein
MNEYNYIYLGKYILGEPGEPYFSDEDLVLKTFESEYGVGTVSLRNRLDFANRLSSDGRFTKEFVLKVLENKKN